MRNILLYAKWQLFICAVPILLEKERDLKIVVSLFLPFIVIAISPFFVACLVVPLSTKRPEPHSSTVQANIRLQCSTVGASQG